MATARFCPKCGKPVDPSATFCGSCGTAMPAPGAPPTYALPGPPLGTAQPYSSAAGPLPEGQLDSSDASSMRSILLAAVFGLIGVVVSLVGPYAVGYSVLSFSTSASAFSTLNVVYALMALAAVGGVFTCIQVWFFRSAFRPLARKDAGLSTPASLSILALIGIVLVLAGAMVILGLVYQWFQCAAGVTPIPPSCVDASRGLVLAAVGLVAVGAILALIGYVSIWLGLWRL